MDNEDPVKIKPFSSLQLATTIESPENTTYPAYVSEKLDGVRCVILDGVMYSRSGKRFNSRKGDEQFNTKLDECFSDLRVFAKSKHVVLDGELYYPNSDFGKLMSVITKSPDESAIMKSGLRFHCFDAVKESEWGGKTVPFTARLSLALELEKEFNRPDLFVVVDQKLVHTPAEAHALFDRITLAGGEGIMIRAPEAPYEYKRTTVICKLKHWLTCEAKILEVHQQACPIQYADEIRQVKGKDTGFKFTAGSVTVEILPDQPLTAGKKQNTTFCEGSVELRKYFWVNREALIGKTVEFAYLKGASKGRMGRITRLRPDKDV